MCAYYCDIYYNVFKEIDGVRDLLRDYYYNKSFTADPKKKYGSIADGVMWFVDSEKCDYSDVYVYRLWYALKYLLTTDFWHCNTIDGPLLQYMNRHHGCLFKQCLVTDCDVEFHNFTFNDLRCDPIYKCVNDAFCSILNMIECLACHIGVYDHVKSLPDSLFDDFDDDSD